MQPVGYFARSVVILAPFFAPTATLMPASITAQTPASTKLEPKSAPRPQVGRERSDKDRPERDKTPSDREKSSDKEKTATPEATRRGSNPNAADNDGKAQEAQALALAREQLPELAEVLTPLKTTHEAEYRKAIAELANDARALAETKAKNPARYPFALDSWRARTRVELIAAQLARKPSAEREQQLRDAIRQRVEADIRRHQFEVSQTEVAVTRQTDLLKKAEDNRDRARAALHRAEEGRDGRIEARFQALFSLTKKAETATGPMPHPASSGPHD